MRKVLIFIFFLIFFLFKAKAEEATPSDSLTSSNKGALDGVLNYISTDSIYIDFRKGKAMLYNSAKVDYMGSSLTSNFMILDFNKQEVRATPTTDSVGELIGVPHFKDKTSEFDANEIIYNFETKKGLISKVLTQESQLYIHGNTVKKMDNNTTYIKGASFTSCNLDHPHFAIVSNKAKIIPNDKVVIGSSMLFIEGIPTPFVIPFGIFPSVQKKSSGLIFPTFGQTARAGYFLRGLGYYFNINDYMDLKLDGDIYTGGNWDFRGRYRYALRYKFHGDLHMGYSVNYDGERGTPERPRSNGYMIKWAHAQDDKAHPNSKFTANVNFVNKVYTKYTTNVNDYLNNTTASNITYTLSFLDRFNLGLNAGATYNSSTQSFDITLPNLVLSMNQFYPFKRKTTVGNPKWYEKISVRYNSQLQNMINATDTSLFSQKTLDGMKNGMKHQVSVEHNARIFKSINWSNSVSYNEYWYLKSTHKYYETVIDNNTPSSGWSGESRLNNIFNTLQSTGTSTKLVTENISGFTATRDFSYNSSLNSRLYGFLRFKNSYIQAFRHVMNPSIGFTFRPDFSAPFWGNYNSYTDQEGKEVRYSRYENALFGSPPSGVVGSLNFSLGNNVEMKVKKRYDTAAKSKNISLLDYFNISTSYNMAADSLKWAPLSISARTRLFNLFDINFESRFDFYKIDSNGRRYNKFVWEEPSSNKGLLRFERMSLGTSFSYTLNPQTFKKGKGDAASKPTANEHNAFLRTIPFYDEGDLLNHAVIFDAPWSISFSYTLNYSMQPDLKKGIMDHQIIQTLSFSGSITLTPKWLIGLSSGYDFVNKDFTYTSLNFTRDLHCWEAGLYWVPFGFRTEWNFYIRIKSPILQDVKLERRNASRDNEFY